MKVTLKDGRSELWQWDTGRQATDAQVESLFTDSPAKANAYYVDVPRLGTYKRLQDKLNKDIYVQTDELTAIAESKIKALFN